MDISSKKKTQLSYHSKNATMLTDLNRDFSNINLNTDVVTMTKEYSNNNTRNDTHTHTDTHTDNTQLQKNIIKKPLQKSYSELQWLTGC